MRKFLRYDPLLERLLWLPVRGAGGGGDVPGPSAAQNEATGVQTDIMRKQLQIARQQQAYSNAISPLMLSQGGYDISPAAKGQQAGAGEYVIPLGGKNYIVKQKADLANLQNLNTQVATAGAERALKASKGELGVDPGVEQDLTRGRTQLQEELLKRLGPGYETSDPGIRAMNEYDRQVNSIRFQVRYGELSNADALSNNAQNAYQRQQSQFMGQLTGNQAPFQVTSNLLGGAGQTAGNIYGQEQSERFGAFNLGLQKSQIGASMMGQGIQGIAQVGTTAAMMY